jgi:transcription elongation factor Elf1
VSRPGDDAPAAGDPPAISRARAERVARAHACVRCREYSYKRVAVAPASAALRDALGEEWHATLVCGVCGTRQELGIAADGDVVYAG